MIREPRVAETDTLVTLGESTGIFLASPREEDTVVELLRAQLRDHQIELDEARLRAGVVGLLARPERGCVLLARDGQDAIGLAVLATTWTVEHGGLVAWLDELYVVPGRRSRGIGQALLSRSVREAKALGCLALELEVEEAHARVERLYARNGFARLSRARWVRPLGA